jgi:hypothetical protein
MIVKHKYNGKIYTLTNENLHEGDKVYGIDWDLLKKDLSKMNTYIKEYYKNNQ